MVHYFFITRLFTGLLETIRDSKWRPSGIPTIVKLVETISKSNTLTWIIICKNQQESRVINCRLRVISLQGINIHVLPFKEYFGIHKIDTFINDMFTLFYCLRQSVKIEKKLFYSDRSNIIPAAALKLIFRFPVILRILGVYPDQKMISEDLFTKLTNPLKFLSYKAPFDLVVCSQDGSGVERYVAKLLHHHTPRIMLLNGVQNINPKVKPNPHNNNDVKVLFVGKLIREKGVLELIETAIRLRDHDHRCSFCIVGKGELFKKIKCLCHEYGIEDKVTLAGSVNHEQMHSLYENADIYVSLNRLGNLSNTVLEAMAAGKCIIMLDTNYAAHTDEFTKHAVPEDTVIRVNCNNVVDDLIRVITDLSINRENILKYSHRMQQFAEKFLWTWEERIEYEIGLLERIHLKYHYS